MTSPAPDIETLPNDVDSLKEMVVESFEFLQSANHKIETLEHRLQQLLRQRYGPKAEQLNKDQLLLFKDLLAEAADENADADESAAPGECNSKANETPVKAHTRQNGRKPLPEDLPRKRQEYTIPEENRHCPDCGEVRPEMGEEVSEQLEYIPASMFVIEHARKKYACRHCAGHVVVADKPAQPIEKGLAAAGLLSQVITSKYADHLPLNRQEEIFTRHGVDISRKTTCDWMRASAKLLKPLYECMKTRMLESRAIWTDDTPVRVQENSRKKPAHTGRVWVYIGDRDHPYTVFDFTPTRKRDGPQAFLKGYTGYMQADAYAGYNHIYAPGAVTEVACWAHARRKFFECQPSDPKRSVMACGYIRQLYGVEKKARELSEGDRQSMRQEKSVPVLNEFEKWLRKQRQALLPKSAIGKAVAYALSNWLALKRYTEDGMLSIDNNVSERALRKVAVGRKNWMFFGSDKGGETAAILYSLTASAKAHGASVWHYLRDVLTRLAHQPTDLGPLLPDKWAESPPE